MTGAEHYAEAERLLAHADSDVSENWPVQTGERKADILAAAQVHATLAQAAAIVDRELCENWRPWRGAVMGGAA
ncbi:hypothetical protein GS676_02670 [Rhodococcus hoagii]|nr:hypothetical protein [Prescottella equi]